MSINKLRKNIDRIDEILLKLFEKRMQNSMEIAKYKIAHHKNIKNLKREKEILKKVKNSSNKNFVDENILLFSVIMYISKNLQYKKIKSMNNKKFKKQREKK